MRPPSGAHKVTNHDLSRQVFFVLARFYHNRRKNGPHDLKNGLERRIPRFCTICDKKSASKRKNGKVMAILVPKLA
jgi:hypothetical protein